MEKRTKHANLTAFLLSPVGILYFTVVSTPGHCRVLYFLGVLREKERENRTTHAIFTALLEFSGSSLFQHGFYTWLYMLAKKRAR
jgi:hypothetical protein